MKHLVRRLYLRRDKIWHVYRNNEVQAKAKDKSITNFPKLEPEDFDYEYIYKFVDEWIQKKYNDKLGFTIQKVDGLEYICKAKRYASLKKILARIFKDYKEIFLGSLKKSSAAPGQFLDREVRDQNHLEARKEQCISFRIVKRVVKSAVKTPVKTPSSEKAVETAKQQIPFHNHSFFKKEIIGDKTNCHTRLMNVYKGWRAWKHKFCVYFMNSLNKERKFIILYSVKE